MRILNLILFLVSLLAIALLYLEVTGTIVLLKGATPDYALAIGLVIPFSLLFLGYVPLREKRYYFPWLILAIGMLIFYFQFRDADILQMKRGSALKSFKSLLGFLVTFQLGRLIFVRTTGREYITPTVGGSSDLFEGRKPQLADFVMFSFLCFSIILCQEL